jgi:hypothetical protein
MDDLTWLACVSAILMSFSWLARSSGLEGTRAAMGSWRATIALVLGSCLAGLFVVQASSLVAGGLPSEGAVRCTFHLSALALALHRWLPATFPRYAVALGLLWLAPAMLPSSWGAAAELAASLLDPRSSSQQGWWTVGGLVLLGLPARARRH